ncbi:MAG: hypothetical protein IJX63_03175 [Lachnospiraceae bacterium]|nr:hypothetical protein [Lachnospiraceae bacterium]
MVKKSDWKTLDMPIENETFILEKALSSDEIEMIKEGYRPQEMEDKWFMYYEEGKLYIHRSWTGFCIFIVHISETGMMEVTVNRNLEQHKETDVEKNKIMLDILLNRLIGAAAENARLMKRYIERGNDR